MSVETENIMALSPSRIGCIVGGALIAIAGAMNIMFGGDFGDIPGLTWLWLTNPFDWPVALDYIVHISTIVCLCLWIGIGLIIVIIGTTRYRTLTLISEIACGVLLVVPSLEYLIWNVVYHRTAINSWVVLDLLMQVCVLVALWLFVAIKPGTRNWLVIRRWAIIILVLAIGFVLWKAGLRVEQGNEDVLGLPTYLPLSVRLKEDLEWFVGVMPFVCGWLVIIASTKVRNQEAAPQPISYP